MRTAYARESQKEEMDLHRNTRVYVRMNEAEKRKFEKLARANHTDLSEFIRQLLHKAADSSKPQQAGV